MQASTILSRSPSFNSYSSSDRVAEIAAKVREESKALVSDEETEEPPPLLSSNEQPHEQHEAEAEDDDDDFEFAVFSRDPDASPIAADEIFYNGQIRPIYPIFNRDLLFADGHDDDSKPPNVLPHRLPLRKLLIEERNPTSSSSSEADEFDGIPAGTYCVWTPKSVEPSPGRCKKSNSTGSSRRWRFRDLLHRSNSDGKDSFVFLSPSKTSTKAKKIEEKAEKTEVSKERRNSVEVKVTGKEKAKGITGETVSAHEIHYVRNRALKEGDRRRSYLPYKQDLVGFFANVNGLSRNLHPPF